MGNDVARDVHYDVTMSNDVSIYTYHGIAMHNDVVMNIFCYVLSALCLIELFYSGKYRIKSRTILCLISLVWRTHVFFTDRSNTHLFLLYYFLTVSIALL